MKTKYIFILILHTLFSTGVKAQVSKNTVLDSFATKVVYLKEITLVGYNSKSDIQQMPDIVGTNIYAGKKSALVVLENVKGNVVTNTMRQVLSKVAGIQIWESDGSGIQIGIGARGLSPNRSWEFNVRQNGYDITADPFGYPEAYYNPQLQSVQRIEIVRGQGSLQYGPQFGGMVNYILKNGSEIKKSFQFETNQTVGSNGLFNSFNAIGGDSKKFHYYAYFDHRNAAGWRQNSEYFTNSGFASFTYKINRKLSLTAEFMSSHIRSKQPGGLTDTEVSKDAQLSHRGRNWLDIKWNTGALIANYIFNETRNARLNIKLFGILADRANIGNLQPITIPDTINAQTLQYNNRQLDRDQYANIGFEARYLADYKLGKMKNTFSAGIRLYKGNTDRSRLGVGDNGTEFNKQFVVKHQDLELVSKNAAVFVENIFRIGDKLKLIPGIRYDYIVMDASGRLNYLPNGNENLIKPEVRSRNIVLYGLGAEYNITKTTKLYANYSQAYRPMLYYDVSVNPDIEIVDAHLKDSKGYNFDLGYRGKIANYLSFDINGYRLQYNNRIGIITQQRIDGSFYNYRTNVGHSTSTGFEGLVEFNPVKAITAKHEFDLNLFISYSYTDARYGDLKVISKNNNTNSLVESNLKNNHVENAPQNILRAGVSAGYKKVSLTGQYSYIDKSYADANNTQFETISQVGKIPSYSVSDLHAVYKVNSSFQFKAGVNNIFDARYFTRRAPSIPGPGALPADGRSWYFSVGAKF